MTARQRPVGVVFDRSAFRAEAGEVAAEVGPVPMDRAVALLPRQGELAAPAKLASRGAGEAFLLADVPRLLDRERCESLVADGLDAALAWLRGEGAPASEPSGALDREPLEEGLGSLGWDWTRRPDGGYRIDARAPASGDCDRMVTVRLWIEPRVDSVRVATETSLSFGAPHAYRAISHFALCANARTRFARVSVTSGGAGVARVVWDAVLPAALPIDRALPEASRAVVCARAAAEDAFLALADAAVARRYLEFRVEAPAPHVVG